MPGLRATSMIASLAALSTALLAAAPAQASEGGASFYLLGSGGPEAAVLPPIEGVFLANTLYAYSGEAGGSTRFPIAGGVVAGLDANIVADFATVLWTPSTNFAGGTLAVGGVLPFGQPRVDVSAVITGPRGGTASFVTKDDAFVLGDPIVTAALGWNQEKVSWQVATLVNLPIGDYREDKLANLAFHRWAADISFAATWHDAASGWDVSGKTGLTFNGENPHTDYRTGTEWHLEASVEKTFTPAWAAGLQAYYFSQLSDDSGPGATLGGFRGEVTGVGAHAAYNFKIGGKIPATLRLHAIKEFAATNRLEGHSVFLDFTMPLWVRLPPGAGAP